MSEWISALTGELPHGRELDWLGHVGDQVRNDLGEGALAWAVETGERIAVEVADMVHAEGAHFNAHRRATTETVLRVLLLISGEPVDLVGPENREIARNFARRGVDLDAVLRSMRRGFALMAELFLEAVERSPGAGAQPEVKRVALLLFQNVDAFLDVAAAEYQQEAVDRHASVMAAQLDAVRQVVADDDHVEVETVSRLLGYPLDAPWHLAVVAWTPQPSFGAVLRPTIDRLYGSLEVSGPTLTLPVGSHAMWSWIALDRPPSTYAVPGFTPESDSRIALGHVGAGLEGFRRSHRQARAIEGLVRTKAPADPVISYDAVELAALLSKDLDAAREMVTRHLGPLAEQTERMADLRRTLRLYLDFERSVSRVAAELYISRNTVTYRVQQAMRLSGHDPSESSLMLHAALAVVDWLKW